MSPLILDDKLLVISEEGVATVFRAGKTFDVLEEHALGETVLTTPAVLNGRLYIRTAENVICIGEP